MQILDDTLLLAPGDLTKHLACPRLTVLDRAVARRQLKRPFRGEDPHLDLIRKHGFAHEQWYLKQLRAEHGDEGVVTIAEPEKDAGLAGLRDAAEATASAMRAGPAVIFQAAFFDGRWRGYADFLLRVERPSDLGDFSYEVLDTKLARSFKPYFAHQLCRYSLHVEQLQGLRPRRAHVVLGTKEHVSFEIDDVLALHRHASTRLEGALLDEVAEFPPEPVNHCDLCDFQRDCTRILRSEDHLSFVASLGRDQRAKLTDIDVSTLAALADMADDAPHGALSESSFTRVHVQAQLQKERRETGNLTLRHLLPEAARGYARLPETSAGDVFFDLEGDPFVGDEGIEYLWGYEILDTDGEPEFHTLWAHDETEERATLERFVDFVEARRADFPSLRVYHYAHHEESTLCRLAAKYGTREAVIDAWLREEVLVDLYAVVRQALQAGVESYSIKKLEPFYMAERESEIREAGGSIVAYEKWLEAGAQSILDEIALYNSEDCRSTRLLRDWLLERRDEAAGLFEVDFEQLREPVPEEVLQDPPWVAGVQALQDALEDGLPTDPEHDNADHAELRLLATLLFYHRRDTKPAWWRFFELRDMTGEELEREHDAIAGLTPDPTAEPCMVKKSICTWMTFPAQEHRLSLGNVVDPATGASVGSIDEIEGSRLLLRQGPKPASAGLPSSLIGPQPFDTVQQRGALMRVATALRDGAESYPAVRALLRRELPRVDGVAPGAPLVGGAVDVDAGRAVTLGLRDTCLAVQGPPGTGKTYTGARMIVAALAAGKRVAVSAANHKAIHNLVAEVEKVAHSEKVALRGAHKHSGEESMFASTHDLVESTHDNDATTDPALNLVSGTPWLFSREQHDGAFDLLFVDEAGQMALADAVAIATCARSIVLLGDPQQLPQVSQGTHPAGAAASVLEHALGGEATIAVDRGLFFGTTWRMHPDICSFISERFYDGRLESVAGCASQRVDAAGPLSGSGLRTLAVEHDGRSQASPEEADVIAAACRELLAGGTAVTREHGTKALQPADILIVAPYNLAVRCIEAAAPVGVRVGTVDRFQGQEAPVVFYAMTSSTGADIPRGLDFLFQPNRVNVAISRARCLAVLVASPRLLDAECNTLQQMRMVNHLCRYAELAT